MIAGLVLAAGAGTRFGRPKALLAIAGERFVDRAVRTLRAGGADPVCVVVGAAEVGVIDGIVVECSGWSEGVGASLRCGLTRLDSYEQRLDGVVIILVDQPGLAPAAVQRVIASAGKGAIAAVSTYGGVRGHPVFLARQTWDEVAELAIGDQGASRFLTRRPEIVTYVDCTGLGDPRDVDTPQDLERFVEH